MRAGAISAALEAENPVDDREDFDRSSPNINLYAHKFSFVTIIVII
jgi:hypothetical protein